jgi:hypothetical protein
MNKSEILEDRDRDDPAVRTTWVAQLLFWLCVLGFAVTAFTLLDHGLWPR